VEDEMGGAFVMHREDKKCTQYFGLKTWKEETTRKT